MFTRVIVILFALTVAFAILGANQPAVNVKTVPAKPTSPASGQEMFNAYCAVCHGPDAKGGGPAASAMKTPPPDLTKLSAKNGGKFPELRVFGMIHGDQEMPAHGSKTMPVWGTVFQSMAHDSGAATQMRIANLTAYVKSLQGK